MSKWSDKFNNHPFLGIWSTLEVLIKNEKFDEIITEDYIEDLARLRKVVVHLNSIIKNIDPELFPYHHLASMQGQTQACINELNAYSGNGNTGHLQNANNNADQLLIMFQQLPSSLYSLSSESVNEAVTAYSTTIGGYLEQYKNSIEDNVTEAQERLETLSSSITEKETELKTLTQELSTVKQAIQQQTTEFNTQYQTSESERAGKFTKAYEKYEENVDIKFKELATKSSKIIEVLVNLQDDASKVYGVTINTLQGGAYSSYADTERKTANGLRYLAGILMLIAVGFLIVPEAISLFGTEGYEFDWKKVLGRIPLSLVVFVPAFYFARESGKHRHNETSNRRRQHILSTLDPYIELMSDNKAEELKSHVAKTVFSETTVSNDNSDNTSNIISQLSNLAKQIKGN
jgi:predicted  nucleic acid-binding Zn-ribbon protein